MNLAGLIKINSVWKDVADRGGCCGSWPVERFTVVSLDLDTDYPVQFLGSSGGGLMRDTVDGFIDGYVPVEGWAGLLKELP